MCCWTINNILDQMQPQLNYNWRKGMIGREVSIKSQEGLSSKHFWMLCKPLGRLMIFQMRRERCEIEERFVFWDMGKGEKAIFHCFGFHRTSGVVCIASSSVCWWYSPPDKEVKSNSHLKISVWSLKLLKHFFSPTFLRTIYSFTTLFSSGLSWFTAWLELKFVMCWSWKIS